MDPQLKLDSTRFISSLSELSRITGVSQKEIIKSEMRSILGTTLERTKSADKKKIRARYTYKGDGSNAPKAVAFYAKIRGKRVVVRSILKYGIMVKTKRGKLKYLPKRLNPQFKELTKVLQKRMKWALSQAGQSKATCLHLAKMIGHKGGKLGSRNVPSYVSSVKLTGGLKRVLKTSEGRGVDYFVEISHGGEVFQEKKSHGGSGGADALRRSFNGRQDFYEKNLEKGVFESAEKVLKKYPEIKVSPD